LNNYNLGKLSFNLNYRRSKLFYIIVFLFPYLIFSEVKVNPKIFPYLFDGYCMDCHKPSQKKGDFDLKDLSLTIDSRSSYEKWVHVYEQIEKGDMPPADKKQVPLQKKNTILKHLLKVLNHSGYEKSTLSMRRLNATEIEKSLQYILGIDVNLAKFLPPESNDYHFDKLSSNLLFSSEWQMAYFELLNAAFEAKKNVDTKPVKYINETYLVHETGSGERQKRRGLFNDGMVLYNWSSEKHNYSRQVMTHKAGLYEVSITHQAHNKQSWDGTVALMHGADGITKPIAGLLTAEVNKKTDVIVVRMLPGKNNLLIVPMGLPSRDAIKISSMKESGVWLESVKIKGPLKEENDSSQKVIFNMLKENDFFEKQMSQLMKLAYRRTLKKDELKKWSDRWKQLKRNSVAEIALKQLLKEIFSSSEFLLVSRPEENFKNPNSKLVADRLSLGWLNSTADLNLIEKAENHTATRSWLLKEAARFMRSPRESFVNDFVSQWLQLKNINQTRPDSKLYPEFNPALQDAMLNETRLYFREILTKNLSILYFLNSDFTFLNQQLAELYQIPGVQGTHMRKVKLAKNHVRGGLVSQASILKITANGTETSPVLRGVWVLENLFSNPPGAPPKNAGAIEPDARGTLTIRQQLEQHTKDPACLSCHRKIDPIGFALENFDVIGGYREYYRNMSQGEASEDRAFGRPVAYLQGLAIAGTGHDKYKGPTIEELKKQWLKDPKPFARAFVKNLMIWFLGREINHSDKVVIEEIIEKTKDRGYRFQDILVALFKHDVFWEK
jgi:hypothetical protein